MKTDIEIAQEAQLLPINEVAKKLGINDDELYNFGKHMAKIDKRVDNENGKLILVTSINPTRSGEGKSTVTVGLTDGLASLDKKVVACLREPSLGPVFGLKGGAAGGGYSQVVPMENINLHFTGDMHAITTTNNLVSAAMDAHIHHGNELKFDLEQIFFKRVIDMNDRNLRDINIGMGSKFNGVERKDGFDITVASEIMAILCLSKNMDEFKERVDNILLALNTDGEPIYLRELNITGSLAVLMQEALKPNLVQTLENTPCIIHGGPFANIAHGCNSLIATKLGLGLADYVVTEAGFGADLGFEKFVDIKSRIGGLNPDCVVIVATIKALKLHGGVSYDDLAKEDVQALESGSQNLLHHIETVKKANLNYVVAINKFATDTDNEIAKLDEILEGHPKALSTAFVDGSKGAQALANEVIKQAENKTDLNFFYEDDQRIEDKLNQVIKNVYGGDGFILTDSAKLDLEQVYNLGLEKLPICIAKTPNSLSGNPELLNVPTGFTIEIKKLEVKAGSGFIVCEVGSIMKMPGLGKVPNAQKIDITSDGKISGLS